MRTNLITYLLSLLLLLGFSSQLTAQIERCAEQECQASILDISTGVNHNTGNLYPIGAGDAFWQLLSVPANAGIISVPRATYVIPSEPIFSGGQPFFDVWAETTNSGWISGQPTNNWTVNGGPYIMERCFCICEPGEYTINMNVWVDDNVNINIISPLGAVTNIGFASGFAFGSSGTNLTTTLFLEEGIHCIQAGLNNSGSTAMGLNIEGTIIGAQMLTSVCCSPASSIVGVKFNDLNCNGAQDADEPGLSGWQIVLDDLNSGITTATTDSDGYYSFVDIAPGVYSVSEVLQGGWTPSLPTGGAFNNITIGTSEVQILNFGNCEGESCINSNGLSIEATSIAEGDFDCCWNLDFSNLGNTAVYGIRLNLLNGVEFEPGHTIANGFFTPNYSNTSLTITNDPLNGNPLPATIVDLIDFCMVNVTGVPQYMTIEYLGAGYEMVICEETLLFDCPITNGCLEYVLDSLVCDSLGYKYTIDFTVPPGAQSIGYIKFNLDSPLPAGSFVEPIGQFAAPAESGHVFPTPLQPGDQVSLMYIVNTPVDLFGDTLCAIITAHDDIEERLCCFAYDGCLPYPLCDPCPYVSSAVRPVTDLQQVEYCCFDLLITDTFTLDPGAFTSIEVTINTPGVTFDGLVTLPALQDGWTAVFDNPLNPTTINWSHNSGVIPNNLINYNLFGFCVTGTTSTDSIDIKINWLNQDAVLCIDTLPVYCPFCLTVVNDRLSCVQDSQGNPDYTYQFSFTNHSPYDVNAIRILDAVAYPGVVGNPGLYILGTTVPPGGTYAGSIPVQLIGNPGDEACFDIILRQIIGEDINITCCYATHCVELLPCDDELPPLLCPDPENAQEFLCNTIFDPVCACNNITYANICRAQNAGVGYWTDGPCELLFGEGDLVLLSGQLAEGGVQLNWQVGLIEYDFFVVRGRWPEESSFKSIATIPYGESSLYDFLHLNSMPGLNEYQILGINAEGLIFPSNIVEIMIPEAQALTTVYAYPNPAGEQIFVTANRIGHATMELITPEGQIYYSQQAEFNGTPILLSTSTLPEGVFIIRLNFNDGETAQRRIVKLRP